MCDAEKDWRERSFRAFGEINGCQKVPLDEPEIHFFFFIYKSLFDSIDPKYNTFMSVVMIFKLFSRGLPKFEKSKTVSNVRMARSIMTKP